MTGRYACRKCGIRWRQGPRALCRSCDRQAGNLPPISRLGRTPKLAPEPIGGVAVAETVREARFVTVFGQEYEVMWPR